MAAVRLIRRTKYVRQIPFLLHDLQMEHDYRKGGKKRGPWIAIQNEHTYILQIKSQKSRISAVPVYTVRYQLGLVLFRYARPQAVLHAEHGEKKDGVPDHRNEKSRKTRT